MRRPDASMSLLADVQEQALEPEYRNPRPVAPSRWRFPLAVALVVLLLTLAVLQTTRGAGATAEQRDELLQRIESARQRQNTLSDKAAALDSEVRALGEQALGDPQLRARLQLLETHSGTAQVKGPGVVIVVGDAPEANSAEGLVLDTDLRRLVNGLRTAGAEAIAINGYRLTPLTPIRSAGAAITVDFVSLSPPYRVEAIGDPEQLAARFGETSGASWWQFVMRNHGLTMTITTSTQHLTLPGDPGVNLRFAKVK